MAILMYILLILRLTGDTWGQAVSQDPQQYTVELLFVMDKRGFDTWYQKTQTGADEQERRQSTVNAVVDFLSSVVVGINNLYESASDYGLRLDVRLKKIHILQEDLWERRELSAGSGDQISTMHALDLFYAWTWAHRRSLGHFDHAMLVTGYNTIDPRNPARPTQGVAYKGAVCKAGRVSVVENTFTYQMVDTAAHEMGHSLGCDHDGENNRCDNSLGHVMSSRTEINSEHRWSFSPCSVEAIRQNIAELNRLGANCLLDTTAGPTPGVELGTLLSPDDQCRHLLGPKAFFCRDFYDTAQNYTQLCVSMWCSASNQEPRCQNQIASDGFVCGNNKVCKRGQCVQSATPFTAPVLDTCPQGEQPGEVYRGLDCPALVSQQPWHCYAPYFQRKCCQSCPSIRQSVPGCEYGDKAEWCSTRMTYPYDCYHNNETCCQSCSAYRRDDNPACPYGDKRSWCKVELTVPDDCPLNSDVCCGTCSSSTDNITTTTPTTTTSTTTPTTPTTTPTTSTTTPNTPTTTTTIPTTTTTTTPTTTTTTTTTISTTPTTTTTSTTSPLFSVPSMNLTTPLWTTQLSTPPPSPTPATTQPLQPLPQDTPTTTSTAPTTASTSVPPQAAPPTSKQQVPQLTTVMMTTTTTTTMTTTMSTTSQEVDEDDEIPRCGKSGDLDPDLDPERCQREVPHGCYNASVLEVCCSTCASYRDADRPGCEFGDMYKNCGDLLYPYACYHHANAEACCATCRSFKKDSRPDCLYGDRHPWCYRLTQQFANEEWCPLDQKDGNCCGTCLYNDTAVPPFGNELNTTPSSTST